MIAKLIVRILPIAVFASCKIANSSFASSCDLTQVQFCSWAGESNGFFSPGEAGTVIGFETLPDGTPSFGGANITPAFNYVLQGAFFSSPFPSLKVVGNMQIGFALEAHTSNPLAHNSIMAQLTNLERGVGVWVIGHTSLFVYDAQGVLITSVFHNDSSHRFFLGVKSNIPIASAVIDDGTNSIAIDDFTMIHVPVPEPSSASLLLLAAPILLRRRDRRGRIWQHG